MPTFSHAIAGRRRAHHNAPIPKRHDIQLTRLMQRFDNFAFVSGVLA